MFEQEGGGRGAGVGGGGFRSVGKKENGKWKAVVSRCREEGLLGSNVLQ